MGAAVALRNVVGEWVNVLAVPVVPLHAAFNRYVVLGAGEVNRVVDERLARAVKVPHKFLHTAFIVQHHLLGLAKVVQLAHVGESNMHPAVEERQFAQPVKQRIKTELDAGESLLARRKAHFGAVFTGVADDFQWVHRVTMLELHAVDVPVTPNRQCQVNAQGIHHAHTHAVQPARNFIAVLVEFTARVQLGHNHFGSTYAFFGMDAGGNPAPVILHTHTAVVVQRHQNPVAISRQRFVDGVIDHFIHHVVQTATVIGVADVHAWALAHGIKAAQNLNAVLAIRGLRVGDFLFRFDGCFLARFDHDFSPLKYAKNLPNFDYFYNPETRQKSAPKCLF